jgi:hypothetical protein
MWKRKTRMLFQSPTILMDGTLVASSPIFEQVYIVHAIKFEQCKNKFFYVWLGFLPDKKSTYKFLVRELQSLAGDLKMNWNPVTSMSDFQGSLVKVISSEVSVILLSCFNFNKYFNFFHLVFEQ